MKEFTIAQSNGNNVFVTIGNNDEGQLMLWATEDEGLSTVEFILDGTEKLDTEAEVQEFLKDDFKF